MNNIFLLFLLLWSQLGCLYHQKSFHDEFNHSLKFLHRCTVVKQEIGAPTYAIVKMARHAFLKSIFIFLTIIILIVIYCQIHEQVMNIKIVKEVFAGFSNDRSIVTNMSTNGSYFSEEQVVCVFPKVDPFEPSVMKVAGLDRKPIQCEGTFLSDLTYLQDNALLVNASIVDEYVGRDNFSHCRYRHIFMTEKNDNWFRYSDWEQPFTNKTQLPVSTEFIEVECLNNNSKQVSLSYYALIPKHDELEAIDSANFKKRKIESNPKETLNIIMIGLDAVSRYQMLRSFNKTYSFLFKNGTSFDLSMHTSVGSHTFPNFLALFADRSHEENEKWWSYAEYLDSMDFIWRTFEKAGYRSFLSEEWATAGAFYYGKKGFLKPFTRYNTRPILLAMDDNKPFRKYNEICAGNQLEVYFHLNYAERFLDKFSDKPVFGVANMAKVTHDDITYTNMLDQIFYNFYQSLSKKGILNKSLLITFSDHGPRMDPIRHSMNGPFESRTPYAILTFPDWFLKKYPDVAENLKVNTKRLTSHFDTHATLLDLLYFKSDNPPPLPPVRHGISLFKKIPSNRTCQDVPIPPEYCVCGRKDLVDTKGISLDTELSEQLAKTVLRTLNLKRDPAKCAELNIRKTIRIIEIETGKKPQYRVKLQTTPGDGLFEAIVYIRNSTFWEVGDKIERQNLYRGQADCVAVALKPYCFCKDMLRP